MSYTLNKTGAQIDTILARAASGGQIDQDIAAEAAARAAADLLKAPLASPALTGTPTAPTAAPGTDTTQLATTAFANAVAAAAAALAASGKADKVAGATAGNLAGLDASGNLTDAGIAAADVATKEDVQNITPKRTASNDPASSSFSVLCDTAIAGEAKPKLYGKSAVINQLLKNGNFASSAGWYVGNSATLSIANNKATVTIANASPATALYCTPPATIQGRKYLISFYITASKATTGDVALMTQTPTFSVSANTRTRVAVIVDRGSSTTPNLLIRVNQDGSMSANDTFVVENVMITDLTAMFSTVPASFADLQAEWLKKFGYPLPQYIDYDAGSIVSNNATYQMHGRNLWDEEWESGTINSTTGQNEANAGLFRSKNYIPVRGSVCVYYGSYASSNPYTTLVLYQYDANKQYIAVTAIALSGKASVYTLNEQTAFVRFRSGGTTAQASYQGDICFNVPDTSFNGQYEAYYNGGSVTADSLNGFDATICDTQDEAGNIVRKFPLTDLGALNWSYGSGYFTGYPLEVTAPTAPQGICAKYKVVQTAVSSLSDGDLRVNAQAVYIKDSNYSDPAVFKAALNGVMLGYEAATPYTDTTTAADLQTQAGYNSLDPVSGDVQSADAEVEYGVDIIAYVDGKLAELQALVLENI